MGIPMLVSSCWQLLDLSTRRNTLSTIHSTMSVISSQKRNPPVIPSVDLYSQTLMNAIKMPQPQLRQPQERPPLPLQPLHLQPLLQVLLLVLYQPPLLVHDLVLQCPEPTRSLFFKGIICRN